MLTTSMLQGLIKEYASLRIAIDNSNINLSTDYVKTKLLQMDVETKVSTSSINIHKGTENKGLSHTWGTKQPKEKKETFVSQKQTVRCFTCNGHHSTRECPNNPNRGKFSKPENSSGGGALVATTYATKEDQVEKNEESAVLTACSANIQEPDWC
jgi:hypothetical protein